MESREILADWDTYSDEHTDPMAGRTTHSRTAGA